MPNGEQHPYWSRGKQFGFTEEEYRALWNDYKAKDFSETTPQERYLFGASDTPPEGYESIGPSRLGIRPFSERGTPPWQQTGQTYGQTPGWVAIQPIIKEARELGFDTSYLERLQYHPMNTESDVRAVSGSAQASAYQMSEAIRITKARQTIPEMQWLSQAYPEEMKAIKAKSEKMFRGSDSPSAEEDEAMWIQTLPEYQKLLGKQKATQTMQQLQFEENMRELNKPRIAEQTARFRPPTRWLNY